MCTSTVLVAEALPVQPEIGMLLSTVERSGMVTSVPFVPPQSGGTVPPPRFSVQALMWPVSPPAASCTCSFQAPLAASPARLTV